MTHHKRKNLKVPHRILDTSDRSTTTAVIIPATDVATFTELFMSLRLVQTCPSHHHK